MFKISKTKTFNDFILENETNEETIDILQGPSPSKTLFKFINSDFFDGLKSVKVKILDDCIEFSRPSSVGNEKTYPLIFKNKNKTDPHVIIPFKYELVKGLKFDKDDSDEDTKILYIEKID